MKTICQTIEYAGPKTSQGFHAFLLEVSRQNPDKIVTGSTTFDLGIATIKYRVWTMDPETASFHKYFCNGEERDFTERQRVKCQNSGITCE